MKRRELLRLAPMAAVVAVIPVLAKESKRPYAPEFNGNPVISEIKVGKDGTPHIKYIDPFDYYSFGEPPFKRVPEHLEAQEKLNQWTSDQLRMLKSRKSPPLKINKINV